MGSIGAGGWYDNLIGSFGENKIEAIGFSIGIERLFILMQKESQKHTSNFIYLIVIGENMN